MTVDITGERPPLDPHCREAHPERITIGGEIFIRDDIAAIELGECQRTLARRDRDGAPHTYFGGVKYRPQKRFHEFLLGTVRERKPAPSKQQRKGNMQGK